MKSLDEFASAVPPTVCKTCALPKEMRDQIHRNERLPLRLRKSRPTVTAWARSEGFDLSPHSIYKHFKSEHDLLDRVESTRDPL